MNDFVYHGGNITLVDPITMLNDDDVVSLEESIQENLTFNINRFGIKESLTVNNGIGMCHYSFYEHFCFDRDRVLVEAMDYLRDVEKEKNDRLGVLKVARCPSFIKEYFMKDSLNNGQPLRQFTTKSGYITALPTSEFENYVNKNIDDGKYQSTGGNRIVYFQTINDCNGGTFHYEFVNMKDSYGKFHRHLLMFIDTDYHKYVGIPMVTYGF